MGFLEMDRLEKEHKRQKSAGRIQRSAKNWFGEAFKTMTAFSAQRYSEHLGVYHGMKDTEEFQMAVRAGYEEGGEWSSLVVKFKKQRT